MQVYNNCNIFTFINNKYFVAAKAEIERQARLDVERQLEREREQRLMDEAEDQEDEEQLVFLNAFYEHAVCVPQNFFFFFVY